MRLIHTFKSEKEAAPLASFLFSQGIEVKLDVTANKDWGSDQYGSTLVKLWIIEEDQLNQAHEALDNYLNNPEDPQFSESPPPLVQT